jgi:hypothetical protein
MPAGARPPAPQRRPARRAAASPAHPRRGRTSPPGSRAAAGVPACLHPLGRGLRQSTATTSGRSASAKATACRLPAASATAATPRPAAARARPRGWLGWGPTSSTHRARRSWPGFGWGSCRADPGRRTGRARGGTAARGRVRRVGGDQAQAGPDQRRVPGHGTRAGPHAVIGGAAGVVNLLRAGLALVASGARRGWLTAAAACSTLLDRQPGRRVRLVQGHLRRGGALGSPPAASGEAGPTRMGACHGLPTSPSSHCGSWLGLWASSSSMGSSGFGCSASGWSMPST